MPVEYATKQFECTSCWHPQHLPVKVLDGEEQIPNAACLHCGHRDWMDVPKLDIPPGLQILDCGHTTLEHTQSNLDAKALRELVKGERQLETLNDRQRRRLKAFLQRHQANPAYTWWGSVQP